MSKWTDKFWPGDQVVHCDLEKVTEDFSDLALRCEQLLPKGRYKSLVLTHLEIAASFATKAFTHGE